jgi:DNA-binding NtrC family response regulator
MEAGGRILVMDDEETVCGIIEAALSFLQYRVTCVSDGEEAIKEYLSAMHTRPFDLVVLDLDVPGGMGGKECLERLRALDPGVKAILSSGYAGHPVMVDFMSHGFVDVMVKPYTIDKIESIIVKALRNDGTSRRAKPLPEEGRS